MPVTESEIYQQQCEEFRALNGIFWQIPVIMTTFNGGLWFALASLDLTDLGQRLILVFAALANVAFLIALIRLRWLLGTLLRRIHTIQGSLSAPLSGITVAAFGLLLVLAALGAVVAAFNPSAVLVRKSPPTVLEISCPSPNSATAQTCTVRRP